MHFRMSSFRKKKRFEITKICSNVFVSGSPTVADANFVMMHVKCLVCLQEQSEKSNYPTFPSKFKILEVPTRDFTSPSEDDLKQVVKFVKEQRRYGGVLLHCKSGKGRSVACAIAYLCEKENVDFETAYKYIRKNRKIAGRASRAFDKVRHIQRL